MKYILFTLLGIGALVSAGCTTAQPIQFEEEPAAPVQVIEEIEPTFEPEIPVTTDEEIVTQPDTSI